MTVEELISELQKHDPKMNVYAGCLTFGFGEVMKVYQQEAQNVNGVNVFLDTTEKAFIPRVLSY